MSPEDCECAWLEWCRRVDYGLDDDPTIYALEPEVDLSVLVIDGGEDYEQALAEWGREHWLSIIGQVLDYELLVDEFDAIHLTADGVNSHVDLTGWDSECTLWLRWAFESVREVGAVEG